MKTQEFLILKIEIKVVAYRIEIIAFRAFASYLIVGGKSSSRLNKNIGEHVL